MSRSESNQSIKTFSDTTHNTATICWFNGDFEIGRVSGRKKRCGNINANMTKRLALLLDFSDSFARENTCLKGLVKIRGNKNLILTVFNQTCHIIIPP